MLTTGGTKASAGTYWNIMNGERVDLAGDGVLPGNASTRYLRAHGALALATAPVIGLLFAVFLPFIAIAMAMLLFGGKLFEGIVNASTGAVTFGWRPIESYLAGRKRKKAAERQKEQERTDRSGR